MSSLNKAEAICLYETRLREEQNFALLNFGEDQSPHLYIGDAWEETIPENIPKKNAVLLLAYELKNSIEKVRSTNPAHIQVPSCAVLRNPEIMALPSLSEFLIPAEGKAETPVFRCRFTREEYIAAVRSLLKHIQQGDVYEVNFCIEFYAEQVSIDPYRVFASLNTITQAPFSGFVRKKELFMMCGSPERFLKKSGRHVFSQPIKGTIRRGKNADEDEQLKAQLRNDPKEQSENVMIVDLVRNDLSRIAEPGSVRVDELFGIYSFPTVHQMISTVSCNIPEGLLPHEILLPAFPMGSMTGAPKIRAMELIDEYEKSSRGWYSGSFGYINSLGDFDMNVVIRSLFYDRKNAYLSFSVGSAITALSDPEKEYDECLLKAEALLKAIGN